jgi:hypothetical protein
MSHLLPRPALRLTALGFVLLALVAAASSASAARPPANDQLRKATVITTTPFSTTLDTSGAKRSPSDPAPSCVFNFGATVFYTITPSASTLLTVDTTGSDYDTVLTVFAVTEAGLVEVACVDDDEGGNLQAYLTVAAEAGTRYVIMVSTFANPDIVGRGGMLAFTLSTPS